MVVADDHVGPGRKRPNVQKTGLHYGVFEFKTPIITPFPAEKCLSEKTARVGVFGALKPQNKVDTMPRLQSFLKTQTPSEERAPAAAKRQTQGASVASDWVRALCSYQTLQTLTEIRAREIDF